MFVRFVGGRDSVDDCVDGIAVALDVAGVVRYFVLLALGLKLNFV